MRKVENTTKKEFLETRVTATRDGKVGQESEEIEGITRRYKWRMTRRVGGVGGQQGRDEGNGRGSRRLSKHGHRLALRRKGSAETAKPENMHWSALKYFGTCFRTQPIPKAVRSIPSDC